MITVSESRKTAAGYSTGARGVRASARGRWLALALAALSPLAPLPPRPALAQTASLPGAATLMADQVFIDGAGRLIASGSVEIWQGSVRLTASRVTFDPRRSQLAVEGPITISDGPDRLFLADQAEIGEGMRTGIITSARVVLNQQMQIAAQRISQGADGVNTMEHVVASSCQVCATNPTPLWEIRSARVIHDEAAGQLEFRRAQFRFAGVPVLYLPRLVLPAPGVTRQRGILRPEVTVDSDLGVALGIPYFIPFGDTRDLTLTPVVSTEGMVSLGFRWRAVRANGGIEIGGQISRDDLKPGETRGYGYVRALFELNGGWRLSADVMGASDGTYLETYGITDDARLSGHVTLERIGRDEAVRARALGFYSMRAADINSQLPNRALQAELDRRIGLERTPLGGELRVQLGAQAFERASQIDGAAGRDVARAHLQLTWRRSAVLAGGILATAALDGRIDHARVSDDSVYPDPLTRRSLQAMAEFRWPWAATSASGARTVVEPIVQLVQSRVRGDTMPNEDHTMPELDGGNLFAFTRYSGESAPDDGSRVNAGLQWTRYDPSGWSAQALVGRIWREGVLAGFNPADGQPLGGRDSHWLLAGRVANDAGYSLSLRLLLDDNSELSRAETNLGWTRGNTTLATRYLYMPATAAEDRATTLSEWAFDISRSLSNGWYTRLGWDYDVEQDLFAAARAGVAYRNECLSFDLSFSRHFVTSTNPTASTRFNLRMELLGIGGRAPSSTGQTCGA